MKKILILLSYVCLICTSLSAIDVYLLNKTSKNFIFRIKFKTAGEDLGRKLNPLGKVLEKSKVTKAEWDEWAAAPYDKKMEGRTSAEVLLKPNNNITINNINGPFEKIEYKDKNDKWVKLPDDIDKKIMHSIKNQLIQITKNWLRDKYEFKISEGTPQEMFGQIQKKSILYEIFAAKDSELYKKYKFNLYDDLADDKKVKEAINTKDIDKQNKLLNELLESLRAVINARLKSSITKPKYQTDYPFLFSDKPEDKAKSAEFINKEAHAQAKLTLEKYSQENENKTK